MKKNLVSIADVENGTVYGPFLDMDAATSAWTTYANANGFAYDEAHGGWGEGLHFLNHEGMGELGVARTQLVEAEAAMQAATAAVEGGGNKNDALNLAYQADVAAHGTFLRFLMEAGYVAREAITNDNGELQLDEIVEDYLDRMATY